MSKTDRKGFFSLFFSSVNLIRIIVVNLVFWALAVFFLVNLLPQKIMVPQGAFIHIRPSGSLVERNSDSQVPPWFSSLAGPESDSSAFRLSRVIRTASEDRRVGGIVLDLSDLEYASLAVLQEIGSDLEYFRNRGKHVSVWADHYNLYSYYLASGADHVSMDPMGSVLLPGYSLYRSYYRNAMDKWNLDMAYFHAGEFKSYGDSYIGSSMSPAQKKESSRLISNLWDQYLEAVSKSRAMDSAELVGWIGNYPENLKQTSSEALLAQSSSLVDDLLTIDEFELQVLKNLEDGENSVIPYDEYQRILDQTAPQQGVESVFVVTAAGPIHEGESTMWSIGADTLIRRLDLVMRDPSARALVLRLDTGGGSAYASELIRRKLAEIKKHGITLLVSMGGVTASGGYWIATAGDEIWTAPGSITGSIGVFTMIPQIAEFAEETLGISSDGVGTTWMSGQERLDQNLNASSRSYYQTTVDQTYSQFLGLVSESRNMSVQALKPLAEGRVWSGSEAVLSGLADHTGTLNECISAAASLAGLEKYNIVYQKEQGMTPGDLMDKLLQGNLSLKGLFSLAHIEFPDLEPGRVYALSGVTD